MKANLYGLKSKQLSLFLVALICTVMLIRSWDKNMILATFVQSQKGWLRVSSGARAGSDVHTSVNYEPSKFDEKAGPTEEQTINDAEKSDALMQPTPNTEKAKDTSDKNNIVKSPDTTHEDVPLVVNQVNKDEEEVHRTEKARGCNYAEGKWVLDQNETHPLYSGFGCKQWLSGMWACRLTQRMNFDYERLKWQPKNCQMEEFDREQFLKRMKNKTIAFVGDSLGRQQFQSLMCMVTGGNGRLDVMDVGYEYGLVKARGAIRPDGWAYKFPTTNTTILYYWSASLCNLEPLNASDPLTQYAMHLDRPPLFLQQFIHKFDVLVLNTGHHWNRGKINGNRWVMHLQGNPVTDTKTSDIGFAKNLTIHSIVKWVDWQLHKNPKLKAFYRSISPRHFANGDWNTGGSCDNEAPMSIEKDVLQDEMLDYSAWSAVRGTNVTLLEVTSLSQVRDEGHISRFSIKQTSGVQDCLHWCLPGVPDTWNEILAAQI